MPKLTWDAVGERYYETGTDRGVLYPYDGGYNKGCAWDGLTGFSESPSGAEPTKIYADNIQYLTMTSAEELGGTITAYQSPEEFDECDGTKALTAGVKIGMQTRKTFGFCYRTKIGNDTTGEDFGYKLHLIYGAKASPSGREYKTVNDSPEAMELSWEITTTPVEVDIEGMKPTSIVTIDSTKVDADKLKAFEKILYGQDVDAFSEEKTYAIGDLVTHASGEPEVTKTYKCKVAVEVAGEWDATDWEETTEDIARLPLPAEVADFFAEG